MTLREIFSMHKQIRIEKALQLDQKIKLAGDKKGFKQLHAILNEDKIDEAQKLNTNEATKENRDVLGNIMNIVKEGK